MISDLYNEYVNVERLATVSANKKTFSAHLADVHCHVQAYDEDITKDITNGFGKDLRLFCDVADIVEGDRVLRDTVEYLVVGIKRYENYGDNDHLEVRIRAFKS
jgi:hypothetical protein